MDQTLPKIALGAWSWGAGAAGGDQVFGNHLFEDELKPVFDKEMECGLNLWDTAAVYGEGTSERILGNFVKEASREDVILSTNHGEKTRSHQTSSISLNMPYRICMPRCDMPISYTSGKHMAKRSFTRAFSFITLFSSPPMYRAGFSIFINMSWLSASDLISILYSFNLSNAFSFKISHYLLASSLVISSHETPFSAISTII